MKSHVHYEAAFEDYLQTHQIPYVAVDEAKRAAFRDAKLKSFDFIVYSAGGPNWLVDIKGRRWAARPTRPRSSVGGRSAANGPAPARRPRARRAGSRPSWQNWVTQADLEGLRQWEEVFGEGFRALLVFAYRLECAGAPPAEVVHEFRDARYVFAGIPVREYELHARIRSPKWGTVNVPVAEFARQVRPMAEWL
ncbi:MAG: HYExAFE family protein [Planctomycetota bacterium]